MKRVVLLSLIIFNAFCTPFFASNIRALLSYNTFNIPGSSPYVETHLSVVGNSIVFAHNPGGKFQGTIEISFLFKQGEKIMAAKKYSLLSPVINDTLHEKPNFIDQQRFPLAEGEYEMEISIADKNRKQTPYIHTEKVSISFPSHELTFSDIEFIESYKKTIADNILTKSGYDLVPYVATVFPENMDLLTFYAELYGAEEVLGAKEKLMIIAYIETNDASSLNAFRVQTVQTTASVNPVLKGLGIENLPSGNYNLVLEVRDKENKVRATRKTMITRISKSKSFELSDLQAVNVNGTFSARITNMDSLSDFIRALRPISKEIEKQFAENQLANKDLLLMQQYFYNFWSKRAPEDPETAWNNYYTEVKKVNKMFGTGMFRGYETDRGRVYLQYGKPDQRSEVTSEPSSYPYEIWQYYTIAASENTVTQHNKRFVFCDSELTGKNYVLIHSEARGEIFDARWQMRLVRRNNSNSNTDDEKSPDHNGSKVQDLYANPR